MSVYGTFISSALGNVPLFQKITFMYQMLELDSVIDSPNTQPCSDMKIQHLRHVGITFNLSVFFQDQAGQVSTLPPNNVHIFYCLHVDLAIVCLSL